MTWFKITGCFGSPGCSADLDHPWSTPGCSTHSSGIGAQGGWSAASHSSWAVMIKFEYAWAGLGWKITGDLQRTYFENWTQRGLQEWRSVWTCSPECPLYSSRQYYRHHSDSCQHLAARIGPVQVCDSQAICFAILFVTQAMLIIEERFCGYPLN